MIHTPVLLEEVIQFFTPFKGAKFIDATLGYGGHTFAILERIPESRVLGIDADASALAFVEEERKRRGIGEDRLVLAQANFRTLAAVASIYGYDGAHGILFDLGISSGELGEAKRGFSFQREGPLDMRFDIREGKIAADIVNQWPADALETIIREYGEERHARRIAEAIVAKRNTNPFTTTLALADCIARMPGIRQGRLHPATKTFQALRIMVNDELGALRDALPQAVATLAVGGRLAVIAFHSLEDRIVKEFLKKESRIEKRVALLAKHVVKPTRAETLSNPRSRSAHLRIAEKIQ